MDDDEEASIGKAHDLGKWRDDGNDAMSSHEEVAQEADVKMDLPKDEVQIENAIVQPNLTDWDGPDDPGNPRNWTYRKKMYHMSVATAIAFLCPFGSSVYTPGHEEVAKMFGVSLEVALLPFTFYLLGLSFGPIIAGPSSETVGRRAVYVSALPAMGAFTLGAGFSQNITALTLCRFFAGLFASPGLSIGTAMVSDFLAPEERGGPVAVFITMVQMGPVFGPIIGGYVTEGESWRWTQWVILFGLVFAFALAWFMSESYKAVLLKRRAKQRGLDASITPSKSPLWDSVRYFLTKTITRPIYMMCTEPIVAFFDIYNAFNFGILNAFFAAFSWTFETVYGFGIGATGLTYLGQAVGSIAGLIIILVVYRTYWTRESVKAKAAGKANMAPEKRLLIAKIGAPMFPISMFWFGWTARPDIHWISPVIAEGFFSCGNLLIFVCTGLYFTDCYGALYSASAWSSCTFIRYLAAFGFPLFIVQVYEALGVGWATSLLGFVGVALMPVPFVLDRYGERLRRRSKFSSGE